MPGPDGLSPETVVLPVAFKKTGHLHRAEAGVRAGQIIVDQNRLFVAFKGVIVAPFRKVTERESLVSHGGVRRHVPLMTWLLWVVAGTGLQPPTTLPRNMALKTSPSWKRGG